MNPNFTAIIIDDEERARRTLTALLGVVCPNVQILGAYKSVPEGVLAINRLNPQVVFLDIEMPDYNGFELLDFFKTINFEVIFVTAYNQYALRAFEVSAIDYLLKPVDADQLQRAVEKAARQLGDGSAQQRLDTLKVNTQHEEFRRIALPIATGLLFVDLEEVVFFEAEGAYTHVILKGGNDIMVSKHLKFFEETLEGRRSFYRPHRSFIININYIQHFNRNDGHLTLDNGKIIPLARNKKIEFEQLLRDYKVVGKGNL